MATDYVKEHPDYVRGVLEDSIAECYSNNECEMCGREINNRVGCHYQCKCGNHVTCSD
jgi:hypothetical protein